MSESSALLIMPAGLLFLGRLRVRFVHAAAAKAAAAKAAAAVHPVYAGKWVWALGLAE
jgi:hypothetical protein